MPDVLSPSTPPPSTTEQARFDQALGSLLDGQFPAPEGPSPGVGYAPGSDGPADDGGGSGDEAEVGGAGAVPPGAGTPSTPPATDEPADAEVPPQVPPRPTQPGPDADVPPAPDTPAPPEPQPAPGPEPEQVREPAGVDYDRIFSAYLGTAPTADQTVALLNFVTEVQSLPPEHQQVIERALRRDPALVAPPPSPASQQQPPTQPRSAWDDDDTPPRDPRVDELQSRLDQYEAQQRAAQEAQYQRWAQYEAQATKDAAVAFAESKGLDATDLAILEAGAQRLGSYRAMLDSHDNDPGAAYAATLDVAYWSNPSFRSRELAQQASQDASRAAEDTDRMTLASAVSASSAAGAAPTAAAPGPRTMHEAKHAAMQDIRQAFDVS